MHNSRFAELLGAGNGRGGRDWTLKPGIFRYLMIWAVPGASSFERGLLRVESRWTCLENPVLPGVDEIPTVSMVMKHRCFGACKACNCSFSLDSSF